VKALHLYSATSISSVVTDRADAQLIWRTLSLRPQTMAYDEQP